MTASRLGVRPARRLHLFGQVHVFQDFIQDVRVQVAAGLEEYRRAQRELDAARRQGASLVEAVNLLGSFFYGGMLGVFVLAFFFPRVRARGAFYGVMAGEAVIFAAYFFTKIAFLWYNVIGCLVVVARGVLISRLERPPSHQQA
jgi:hypothetical protein